jgi:hypothetical protein
MPPAKEVSILKVFTGTIIKHVQNGSFFFQGFADLYALCYWPFFSTTHFDHHNIEQKLLMAIFEAWIL